MQEVDIKNLEVKLVDNYRKTYELFLKNIEIGKAEINFENGAFVIFDMNVESKFRLQGYGEFFSDWLIENLAKSDGYNTIIAKWLVPYLIMPLKRRGFSDMTKADYEKFGQNFKKSNLGREVSLIKVL